VISVGVTMRRFLPNVESTYALGADRAAVRAMNGAVATVQSTSLQVLETLRGARSLDEHAVVAGRELGLPLEELRRAIQELVRAGALADYDELLEHRATDPSLARANAPVRRLLVPTCDRPDALERCIRSYAANAFTHGRTISVIVGDDSREGATRESLRSRLRSLARSLRLGIRYAGDEEKVAYAAALAEASRVSASTIRFALFGPPDTHERMGDNRNVLLLDSVDERAVSVDDDTVCRLTAHPEVEDRLTLGNSWDPTEFWFFRSRDEALSAACLCEADFFGVHERLLGRTIRSLLTTEDACVSGAGTWLTRSLASGKGRVAVTYSGVLGDSGMYSGANLLHLSGATRARLVGSKDAYQNALASREVLRVARAPTICRSIPFMGTFYGIDGSSPLPPFVPTRRNEDGVFGFTLMKCFAFDCFGHLPFAAVHDPEGRRAYVPDRRGEIETVRLSDIIIQGTILAHLPDASVDWTVALDVVGRELLAATSSQVCFDRFVVDRMCKYATSRLAQYRTLLRAHGGSPSFWADDVGYRVQRLEERLTSDDYFVAADVTGESLYETSPPHAAPDRGVG
jgi:hypothetical protein